MRQSCWPEMAAGKRPAKSAQKNERESKKDNNFSVCTSCLDLLTSRLCSVKGRAWGLSHTSNCFDRKATAPGPGQIGAVTRAIRAHMLHGAKNPLPLTRERRTLAMGWADSRHTGTLLASRVDVDYRSICFHLLWGRTCDSWDYPPSSFDPLWHAGERTSD